uniref:Conserved oligomeric Golgi complex subunit 7 n=2 Tax=Triatoma infestans TaxID=30076 RepID=A0A023EY93_TRIIF
MDISAFSEECFDAKDWINKTFQSTQAVENKDAFLSSLVAKLQLYVQQVNGAIEETSEHVLKHLPRVMHDADMIQREALMLKEKMQLVKEEIIHIQKGTADSMAILEKLDKMKMELQTAKQALHEADNWTVLANDIEDVFETHNADAIASKVMSMQQSLVVLANSVDFEDRKLQLESFKNRLEAITSPALVTAFTNKNIDESKKYVNMFTGMERLPQLVKYYSRCEKGSMCREWTNLVELDQDHGVIEWLAAFYHSLLINWQSQVKWCSQVFGSVEMLPSIYVDVLVTLQEDITCSIEVALKQQPQPVSFLIQLKEVTDRFADNMRRQLELLGNLEEERWPELERTVYSIYIDYVKDYRTLEERQIGRELWEDVDAAAGQSLGEAVEQLAKSTSRLVAASETAVVRCMSFTSGASLGQLAAALEFCFLKHLEQYRTVIRQIEVERLNKEDWTIFHICLTLLQSIGDLQSSVEDLNRDLIQKLLGTDKGDKYKSSETDYKALLLTTVGLQEHQALITALKQDNSDKCMLGEVMKKLAKLSNRANQCTLDVMMAPVLIQLQSAQSAWNAASNFTQQLPDYSYAPLEYITQIGEYLMTVPQHLEPFLGRESDQTNVEVLLGKAARQTCNTYADLLLSVTDVSPNQAKQISTDIGYLGNVLEDLGFGLTDTLSQIAFLLKLPAESYQTQSSGRSAKLVSLVRQMRNIISS